MADYRSLEIKVAHARHLKNVNLLSKMDTYVAVSLSSDQQNRHKTPVDRTGNKNPTWNFPIRFTVDLAASRLVRPTLTFTILCERALGDKPIGEVHVALIDLLDSIDHSKARHVAYQVRRPSGRGKGELSFSYQWGQRLVGGHAPSAPPLPEEGKGESVVTAYPLVCGTGSGHTLHPSGPPGGYQYQYPPVVEHSNYLSQSYVSYPPSHQYGGYLTPPREYGGYQTPPGPSYEYQAQPSYGYQTPPGPSYGYEAQPSYGYQTPPGPSYGYPPVQPAPKKNKSMMGLGVGLLGGLLVGDLLF